MKTIIIFCAIVIAISTTLFAAMDALQVGASGSGRSSSGSLRLESVIGQNVAGISGNLGSGFLSSQALPNYIAGDVDGNKLITISDVVFLINYIFAGGAAPPSSRGADADCNGIITISDGVYLLNFIFAGGPAPHYC